MYEKALNPSALEKGSAPGWISISFYKVLLLTWHGVEIRNLCLLASMEQIFVLNCSLLYLHSNDMNKLKQ